MLTASRGWRADDRDVTVPVCRPALPQAADVLPYLREIDAGRRYTNHGPLARRLEALLAARMRATRAGDAHAVLAANATIALTATLRALDVPPGAPCVMPAWTFAATGHAVVAAGLVPVFADVDPDAGGALTPACAARRIAACATPPAAVVAVSPYGRPVDIEPWRAFRAATGVPVVLDAAAAFDSVVAADVPAVVSLHATKVLGIGEGAFVACDDAALARRVALALNFGFDDTREALVPALNGKLSEYAAAVGLAALDAWPRTRAQYARVLRGYAEAFAGSAVTVQDGAGERWVAATAIVRVPARRLDAVEDALAAAHIGSRRWWGDGLARTRAFAAYAGAPLPATDELAATTLGLPCWPDLPDSAVREVARIVSSAAA